MKAVKGNKVYTIDEKQQKSYADAGFDIKDDDGKVITYGRGKTVPYNDYTALDAENKALKAKIKELEAAQTEIESEEVEPQKKAAGKKA